MTSRETRWPETLGIVLAAGKGTRMKSKRPKVLHPLLGRPMVEYALRAVEQALGSKPVLVIGHQAEVVRNALGPDRAHYVYQDPPMGTGDAVRRALEAIPVDQIQTVIVTNGDMPLLRAETLQALLQAHRAHLGPITLLTVIRPESQGFGRVIRDADGRVLAIVEEAHATPEQRAIRELNVGVYAFDARWLVTNLPRLPLSPKGEYYLTDTIALAVQQGLEVRALPMDDPTEALGVNTRGQLARAARAMQQRILERWMQAGVTFIDPDRTYVEDTVTLGQDTVVWPDSYLIGKTVIGEESDIGPNTYIRDSRVGDRCRIFASVIEEAVVEDDVDIGPYSHLRKGAHLARGVHMGNFGEVKNAYLGPGVKMGHFSYIGDATIEEGVNIGAGTITCNYDGERKHPTYIGAHAFIGSDTMLVAPIRIGEGARTGAGAVVTKDVPPYTLAVGVPARVIRRLPRPKPSEPLE
ncbi:MAG: UDP-N-acetylglucosamine diphosphorylase/glucosamine-1-phosphate N-acetyltransferase [Chloroflexi bacterium]|nr:UDP-N-acetylglucosamine diphosphorylase/glucosamine-1-phosphate N-acetyltransferase [Chloroflexota bacterium]